MNDSMKNETSLALNYDYSLEIDTTPRGETETWAVVSDGFDNLSKSLNEVLYQGSYLGDGGWGSTEVTGGQMTFTLSGVRKHGDAAQDYIFSDAVKHNWGMARKTRFRITYPDGAVVQGRITLAKITEGGGSSQNADAVTVEIHFNGKPEYTPAETTEGSSTEGDTSDSGEAATE